MIHAESLLTDEERRKITFAIQEAERTLDAEILVVVADASGRYDRAEDVFGLMLGILLMLAAWSVMPFPVTPENSWASPSYVLYLMGLVLPLLVGFICGAIIASRFDLLRALLVSPLQMKEEVQRRAFSTFYDLRVHHTEGRHGVLIYVSLLEQRAIILADFYVLDRLGGSGMLQTICNQLIVRIKETTLSEAIYLTVFDCKHLLSSFIPRSEEEHPEGNGRVTNLLQYRLLPDMVVLLGKQ